MRTPPLALFRAGLISALLGVLAGCSANPAVGALKVEVILEANTVSQCVKVFAQDDSAMEESEPLRVGERSRPLVVAIYADKFAGNVRVRAQGYSDTACNVPANETSQTEEAGFGLKPASVTLTLKASSQSNDGGFNPDGGTDAGVDGGTDGGFDAGIDQDNDGVPLPADCDDTNPNVKPGATESCINGIDDDCDNAPDCMDSACANMACPGGGTCVGTACMAPTETGLCTDGVDNDSDGRADCLDSDCTVGTSCNDFNACTTGERCVVDGGCEKTGDVACMTPPGDAQCFAMNGVGVCLADAGTCMYSQLTGGCNDGNACTMGDTCANGTCAGTQMTCNTPPNSCFGTTGACAAGTCTYTPLAAGTGTCSDGNNCTINDSCAGDGGCAGTVQTCTPASECEQWSGTCQANGMCDFAPRTGQPCTVSGQAGTCNSNRACIQNPPNLFPYTPSNFTEAQLPTDGGVAFNVNCAVNISTSGTPTVTTDAGTCITQLPPYQILSAPNGGPEVVLVKVSSFDVTSGNTLRIVGDRAIVFAVTGSANVNGSVRAINVPGAMPAGCNTPGAATNGGGGGGAFGSAGGNGGRVNGSGTASTGATVSGNATLTPLRSGCHGLNSSQGGNRGAGGGAFQLTVAGTLNVNGIIYAPGRGANGTTGDGASGGGGGSGGGILLEAVTLNINAQGRVTANGGGGAGGEDANDGSAGTEGDDDSATPASGGPRGGSAGGNGGAGAAGATAAGNGGNSGNSSDGAGGGGGGVGRIRFNAGTCNLVSGHIVSPAATSSGGTGCP
jgi:hypothetical protein